MYSSWFECFKLKLWWRLRKLRMPKGFMTYGIIKDGEKVKQLMSNMTDEQRYFLNAMVIDASKERWKHALLGLVGGSDTVNVDLETLNGWRLHFVEDLGTQSGTCVCGHKIRYVCHVEHLETGKRIVLGTTCVQKIFNISMGSAKRIAIAMSDITSDRDEVLTKIETNWALDPKLDLALMLGHIHYSSEAKQFKDLGLPLLCKHEEELYIQHRKFVRGSNK